MSLEKSERPWGSYEVLGEFSNYKVKTITVKPGGRLSYQKHQKRAEHWFIVSGNPEVTVNGEIRRLAPGDSTQFAIGVLHRISNTGPTDVVFVEIQTGTYFGEDDIERVEDDYGRLA
jgi:mannose-6-phosphate isomerase